MLLLRLLLVWLQLVVVVGFKALLREGRPKGQFTRLPYLRVDTLSDSIAMIEDGMEDVVGGSGKGREVHRQSTRGMRLW